MAAYKKWEDVLESVKDSTPDTWFLIRVEENGEIETHTRFMNKLEAIAYCFYKRGRQRVGL